MKWGFQRRLIRIRGAWIVSCAIELLFASGIHATNWELETRAGIDNETGRDADLLATWYPGETRWGWPRLRTGWHRVASGSVAGLQGGREDDLPLWAGTTWAWGSWKLDAEAGAAALPIPASLGGALLAETRPSWLFGARAKFELSSRWMDGWFSRGVRANAAQTALSLDGPRTWAELGGRFEERTGGRIPAGATETVALPDNRLGSAWAWCSRSWTSWLQAGVSASWADASRLTHQAVTSSGDTLAWADIPYPSPHDRLALGLLLRLSARRAWIRAHWPAWSTDRRRVDALWAGMDTWTYKLRDAAPAEISLGGEIPVGSTLAGVRLDAISSPYASRAWFQDDAWNRIALSLTLKR